MIRARVVREPDPQLVMLTKVLLSLGYAAVLEHQFHPERKWRFDLAVPEFKVALEVQGGTFPFYQTRTIHGKSVKVLVQGGGHSTGAGARKDREKYNAAQIAGWIVLQCEPREVKHGSATALVIEACAARLATRS